MSYLAYRCNICLGTRYCQDLCSLRNKDAARGPSVGSLQFRGIAGASPGVKIDPMTPGERIKHIVEIKHRLKGHDWSMVDLYLSQFGFPTTDQWSGHIDEYVMEMLQGGDDAALSSLASELGYQSDLAVPVEVPGFWKPGFLRLFISHLAKYKEEATKLQGNLVLFGISCFVAHEDIEPTREWQTEIEKALETMQAMVALFHPEFHESRWTDQEIGVALGRKVPVVPVRLGLDPYGFVGKIQAVNGRSQEPRALAEAIFQSLSNHSILWAPLVDGTISALAAATNFDQANKCVRRLRALGGLTKEHVEKIEQAERANGQVRGAYEVTPFLAELRKKLGLPTVDV